MKAFAAFILCEENNVHDKEIWKYSRYGNFTIKSAYRALSNLDNRRLDDIWNVIWKAAVEQRVRVFLWLVSQGKLMVNEERCKRAFSANPHFSNCPSIVESICHVLKDCVFASRVWESVLVRSDAIKEKDMEFHVWFK